MLAAKNRALCNTAHKSFGLAKFRGRFSKPSLTFLFPKRLWTLHRPYMRLSTAFTQNWNFQRTFCTKECQGMTVQKEGEKEKVTVDLSKIRGAKMGNTGLYMIMYTCNVCQHRQARTFTKGAYHHGVVIVRCENCENFHLIADNLGWFRDDKVNIEALLKEKGDSITKIVTDQAIELLGVNSENSEQTQ